MKQQEEFMKELLHLVNKYGLDSLSKMPDYIIANSMYAHFLNTMITFQEYRRFHAEKEADNGLH